MSFDFFEKIVHKDHKHKNKKNAKQITVEDFINCGQKKDDVGSYLIKYAKSQKKTESSGSVEVLSTLKVPENDFSANASDQENRRSSWTRMTASAGHSPRRSFASNDNSEPMAYGLTQRSSSPNPEGTNMGSNLPPMSAEEASKYHLLYPLLNQDHRSSSANQLNLETSYNTYASKPEAYPDSTRKVQPPSLPYPLDQGASPDPTIFLCDMSHQLRELVLKRLKALWDPGNPLQSVEPLIEELNQTQGRQWTLDMLDNPCDLTGSRAFKGCVLSFTFAADAKPYVLWRRQIGDTKMDYQEWLW